MLAKRVKNIFQTHVAALVIPTDEGEIKEFLKGLGLDADVEKYGKYIRAWNMKPCYAGLARTIRGGENLFIYIQDGVLKIDAVIFGEEDEKIPSIHGKIVEIHKEGMEDAIYEKLAPDECLIISREGPYINYVKNEGGKIEFYRSTQSPGGVV